MNHTVLYHQATLNLIGEVPNISPQAITLLDQWEHIHARALPPSVREWYTFEQALPWLERYSNGGHPIEVAHLGRKRRYRSGGSEQEIDFLTRNLLPILTENQGMCMWAVQLDGSENPPVVVSFDYMQPESTWHVYVDSFSHFVYTCVWDARVIQPDVALFGTKEALLPEELLFLQKHFQQEPITYHFPAESNYRFSSEDQYILLQQYEYGLSWYLFAEEDNDLKQLVKTIWQCESLKKELRLERAGLTSWEAIFPDEDFEEDDEE
jgi:hypothetical protein